MTFEQDKFVAFKRFTAMLTGLGFKLGKIQQDFDCMVTANIKLANKNVARLTFQALNDHASLFIQPVDSLSTKITAGSGRITNQVQLDKALTEVETLFRTMLVLKGKLDFYEFPTDSGLVEWVGKIAELDSDGLEYWQCLPIETAAVEAIVGVACDLSVEYDRSKALLLHSYVMAMEIFPAEATGAYDRAEFFVRQSAISMSDTLFQRCQVALQDGSGMAYLYTEMDSVPLRQVPEMDLEMVQSFGM